jgi:hypothetical protein
MLIAKLLTLSPLCKIRGSHGSRYKDYALLRMIPCSLVDTYQLFLYCERKKRPRQCPSVSLQHIPINILFYYSTYQHFRGTAAAIFRVGLLSSWQRQHVPPKYGIYLPNYMMP